MHRAAFLLAALLLAAAPAARAQGDSIAIRLYKVDAFVDSAGVTHVAETLRLHFFGAWNGINRDLSLEHRTAQGWREKLRVTFEPPTDEQGRPLRHEISTEGWTRRVKMWVPGARDAERTVVIRYRVANAIRFYQEGSEAGPLDELYWNITGNGWEVPIDRVLAVFQLPHGVQAKQAAAYTGHAGSRENEAEVSTTTDGRVIVETRRRLQPGEGLTVGVGWEPGVIPRPSAAAVTRMEMVRLWPLLLPFLAFYHALRAWRRRGRDPEAREVVVAYEPPAGMRPAEVGTLIDHRPDLCDITATLVDLAVRGYVGVQERVDRHLFGLLSSTEYVFHLRAARGEWNGLADHERAMMNALFSRAVTPEVPWEEVRALAAADDGGGARMQPAPAPAASRGRGKLRPPEHPEMVELSALKNNFYRSLPGIHDAIYDRLVERGYYRTRPDKVKALWAGMAFAIGMVAVLSGAFTGDWALWWVDPLALGLGLGVCAVVVFLFGLAMPARTEAGARAREAALGFREFLSAVESDRFRRMITSPELFERYLPYAMAFQVERRWARAFDDLYTEPPQWYSGSSRGFRASSFTSDMRAMSSAAGSTMSSSPRSSGSGGGGSSGGGSGGGGGGGF